MPYNKTSWGPKQIITSEALNKIENQLEILSSGEGVDSIEYIQRDLEWVNETAYTLLAPDGKQYNKRYNFSKREEKKSIDGAYFVYTVEENTVYRIEGSGDKVVSSSRIPTYGIFDKDDVSLLTQYYYSNSFEITMPSGATKLIVNTRDYTQYPIKVYKKLDTIGYSNICQKIPNIDERVKNLEYQPFEFTSFTLYPDKIEKGNKILISSIGFCLNGNQKLTETATINNGEFTLPIGKQSELYIDETMPLPTAPPNVGQITEYTGYEYVYDSYTSSTYCTDNKLFSASYTDKRNITRVINTWLHFCYKIYYGISEIPSVFTSSFILNLPYSILAPSYDIPKSFTVTANENQYIWYAIPTEYGTRKFKIDDVSGGFQKVVTLNHTNSYNVSTNYDIYRSDYPNLGRVTVKIE